jgi:hypothetical protein
MKEIVRIYVKDPKTGRERGEMDPEKIVAALSKPTEDIELDYDDGSRRNVRMGTSKELVGEKVKVGDMEIEIPAH